MACDAHLALAEALNRNWQGTLERLHRHFFGRENNNKAKCISHLAGNNRIARRMGLSGRKLFLWVRVTDYTHFPTRCSDASYRITILLAEIRDFFLFPSSKSLNAVINKRHWELCYWESCRTNQNVTFLLLASGIQILNCVVISESTRQVRHPASHIHAEDTDSSRSITRNQLGTICWALQSGQPLRPEHWRATFCSLNVEPRPKFSVWEKRMIYGIPFRGEKYI